MSNDNLARTLKPRSWRTAEMHQRYETEREAILDKENWCPLCDAPTVTSFEHWRIIPNKYPYDAVARVHEQLVPLRHTDGTDLTQAEQDELQALKHGELNLRYSFIFEALPGAKSIPGHFHLHLMVPKVID